MQFLMILTTTLLSFSICFAETIEIDIDRRIAQLANTYDPSYKDNDKIHTQKFIPTNITRSNDTNILRDDIVNHSMRTYLNSEVVKNSHLAHSIKAIEKNLVSGLTIGSVDKGVKLKSATTNKNVKSANNTENTIKSRPRVTIAQEETDHRFQLQIHAPSKQAKLKYKGWFSGSMNYDVLDYEFNAEVDTQLTDNTSISLKHKNAHESQDSTINMNLRW